MRCKNVGGGPGDERPPPGDSQQPDKGKGKQKQLAKKKRKRGDMTTEEVLAAVASAERAEQGGSSGSLRIGAS